MDPLFDRFERLIRSMFQEPEGNRRHDDLRRGSGGGLGGSRSERDYIFDEKSDRDFRNAWDELEDYLRADDLGGFAAGNHDDLGARGGEDSNTRRDGFYSRGPYSSGARRGRAGAGTSRTFRPRGAPLPPEELRQDYSKLGVHFGASFEEVRKAYRALISAHHPDKYAENEEESSKATKRSQEINESFGRIKEWHKKSGRL